ncbi:hypothetical protein BDW59DRAFT_148128 [Aspergillus cavernicola]|uniref:Uncharacterized protein n=1 Tax=Aspergillus cavernicola TaxID=176166 RepID=A0ABR4IAK7_9EURO
MFILNICLLLTWTKVFTTLTVCQGHLTNTAPILITFFGREDIAMLDCLKELQNIFSVLGGILPNCFYLIRTRPLDCGNYSARKLAAEDWLECVPRGLLVSNNRGSCMILGIRNLGKTKCFG